MVSWSNINITKETVLCLCRIHLFVKVLEIHRIIGVRRGASSYLREIYAILSPLGSKEKKMTHTKQIKILTLGLKLPILVVLDILCHHPMGFFETTLKLQNNILSFYCSLRLSFVLGHFLPLDPRGGTSIWT